jgi:hypothetical protein
MNCYLMFFWQTQKISGQYEHFYYGIRNNEKSNFLADVYVSSALGGLKALKIWWDSPFKLPATFKLGFLTFRVDSKCLCRK